MTLEEAIEAFEARFSDVRTGEPSAYYIADGEVKADQTVHVFVSICRGEHAPTDFVQKELFPWAQTQEEAVAQWFAVACAYATRIGGKRLVWRVKPGLEELVSHERKARGWQVYSRLVVF